MVAGGSMQELIDKRLNRVLTVVELSVPREKYELCRKVILDEFGRKGLVRDLEEWFGGRGSQGRNGSGGPIPRREDGAL